MIIKDLPCIVFDVEVLKNVFTCTCKNTETGILKVFELSPRINTMDEMIEYFSQNCYFVGYNNIHYDNCIINYIIELFYRKFFDIKSTIELTESIYRLGQLIISDEDSKAILRYKFAKNFKSIDLLTMLYSKALRVSLKEMQVTMQYKNVEEFTVDWNDYLPIEDIDKLISYNINDVNSTEELLNRCKEDLQLRIDIEKEFGLNCLSLDRVNLGDRLLKMKYMEYAGITKEQLDKLSSPADFVDLEKVIFPWIKFNNPILQKLLKDMKNEHMISPGRKGYENTFVFGGMKVTVGVGGIHGDCGTGIIKPKDDEMLLDSDVGSLYPSMMIEHKLYPPHLGKEFLITYSQVRSDRFVFKKTGQKNKSETYKYMLNGASGKLQEPTSWLYSPFTAMQIRINGQLLLLALCEKLLELDCKLYQINTDGVLYSCKKDKYKDIQKVMKEWETMTKLTLETEEFTAFYQLAINDYFGVTPKYAESKNPKDIKKKGFFLSEIVLGKGLTPKIIPEAIINKLVHNIPVEETIKNCKDIRKFLQSEKTGKQWHVEYNDLPQQRINRFYASTNGYYLWKWKTNNEGKKEYQIMLKDYGVTIHNTLISDDELQQLYSQGETFESIYHVNYKYYAIQATKIVEKIRPRQTSLFDFD